jgi:uroporphyrinogen decarboxylase
MGQTIFEKAWLIRSMEELLPDMLAGSEMAGVLMDRLAEIRCFQAATFARADVDILRLGDDVTTQRGMMMSPDTWRDWLKPRLARVIDAAREVKPDILIWYHSDGDCRAIVPELIEIGVDILNPVQPECMDPAEMKRLYGDRLSFSGTIGTQTTMPFGTPEEVRREVGLRIETVGRGGGLLLAPTHVLEPDVPWENIVAFVRSARELGRYR